MGAGTQQIGQQGALEKWRTKEADLFSQTPIVDQVRPGPIDFKPTLQMIPVGNPEKFLPGMTVLVQTVRKDPDGDPIRLERVIRRKDDNVLTLDSPLDYPPLLGGFVYRLENYRFDYIDRAQSEALEATQREAGAID